MASSDAKKSCTKCLKGQGQVLCGGCQRWYCVTHLLEHRQELSQQMDNLTLEHDQFQQTLLAHDSDRPNPLITRIDRWETKSIEKIKQVAREVRQDLKELIDQSKKDLVGSLRRITDELQENRQMETYTENDLERWTCQLRELRGKLIKPIMTEIKYDEEKESSTHLPLIQLRMIKPNRGKKNTVPTGNDQFFAHQQFESVCLVPTHISNVVKWSMNGQTVAGDCKKDDTLNQIKNPYSIDVGDDGTLFIADHIRHQILRRKPNAQHSEIIVGGKGPGSRNDQLDFPLAVLFDRINNALIVGERGKNRRVMRWPLDQPNWTTVKGEEMLSNIVCFGLAMDHDGTLYVSDFEKHVVRRYGPQDGKDGVVVAGGHGRGPALNQLDHPQHIFVDDDYSVYISDHSNHRVMKWMKDAKEGVVVAGGQGQGNSLEHLSFPCGIFVDRMNSVYVVDTGNDRVMRWSKGAEIGEVIVGGKGRGSKKDQLSEPASIALDDQGNLYVADYNNNRIQRFDLEFLFKLNPNEIIASG